MSRKKIMEEERVPENEINEIKVEQTQPEKPEEAGEEEDKKGHSKSEKEEISKRIEELEESLATMKDKHLRLQAEFDNFRKRTLREKAELIKSGGETVLTATLPIIDDFERALETMHEVAENDPAKTGFLLIYNKFREFLKNNNVTEIETTGLGFDVDRHFAVTAIPAPSEELKGKIVDVIEKGYSLNDKVIRFAKVVIGE